MSDRSPTVEKEVCPTCGSKNINWQKTEVEIGDKSGSVADVQFEYCDDCGWHGPIEWFD